MLGTKTARERAKEIEEETLVGGHQTIKDSYYPVTWWRLNYAGTQVTQWDFQNKGSGAGLIRASSFVLKVASQHNLFRTM